MLFSDDVRGSTDESEKLLGDVENNKRASFGSRQELAPVKVSVFEFVFR